MAIKLDSTTGRVACGTRPDYNAMIIEIIRTGQLLFFDGDKIILLRSEEPSITKLEKILFVGRVVYDFVEKEELKCVLLSDGDRYILQHITETIRVVSRFRV